MQKLAKKRVAEMARIAFRKQRIEQATAPLEELDLPQLNDRDIVDKADGTLNKDVIEAGNGLTVSIPKWANVSPPGNPLGPDTVTLQWASGSNPADGDYEDLANATDTRYDDGVFPVELVVPNGKLHPDGPYSLRYRVDPWNQVPTKSPSIPVICDNTPPCRNIEPDPLVFPNEPITDEYLANNPAGVAATIPPYKFDDWQSGDKIMFWYGKEPLPDDPSGLMPVGGGAIGNPNDSTQTALFTKDNIEGIGDGGCLAVYALFDKATNRSRFSGYSRIAVALGPLPDALKDPEVPQANKGWIDLKDAIAGVIVEIPRFENGKATDLVEVTWGTTPLLPARPIGASPRWPLEFPVPNTILHSEYIGSADPDHTPVSYRVLRGTVPFGPMSAEVAVDFAVIGPPNPDPDWPNPVNPDLDPPTVHGKNSSTPNVLTRADKGEDAILTFDLYGPVEDGEVIEFYWGDERVTEAQFKVAGESAGEEIERIIPWKYIEEYGNSPDVPIHYRIMDPDSPNEQHSRTTPVDVDAIEFMADPPTYRDAQGPSKNLLNCASLDFDGTNHAVVVEVPDLTVYGLGDGEIVTMKWEAYAGFPGGGGSQGRRIYRPRHPYRANGKGLCLARRALCNLYPADI